MSDKICSVEGCDNLVGRHGARGMCPMHYSQWRKHGHTYARKRIPNGLRKQFPAEYNTWYSLKRRCLCENNRDYHYYGDRGITVCDRWLGPEGFLNFLEDMGPRPGATEPYERSKYSIDRIDNDGPYSPENCRWATAKEQIHNRRPLPNNPKRKNNVNVIWHGETHSIAEWSRILGLSQTMLYIRYKKRGLRGDALFAPSRYKTR